MNAVECIKTRRSVRKFTDEMVSVDTVREIVELASYAPSWKNTQVIRYTLVEDPEIIAKIAAEGVMDFLSTRRQSAERSSHDSHQEGRNMWL